MRFQPTLTRSDLLVIISGPLLGLLLALFLADWRWFPTGLLVSAAGLVVVYARERGYAWTVVTAVIALLAGLALLVWIGDARWAVLGLFPIAFVAIGRIASAIENRR